MVAFTREARGGKPIGKAFAQVPVNEENRVQAARAQRTLTSGHLSYSPF